MSRAPKNALVSLRDRSLAESTEARLRETLEREEQRIQWALRTLSRSASHWTPTGQAKSNLGRYLFTFAALGFVLGVTRRST